MGKHATYRGVPSDHYRMMRNSMDAEAFGKWVQTVTGKPRNTRKKTEDLPTFTENGVDWETLAKKLQRALAKQINENDQLKWEVSVYRETLDSQLKSIEELESRSWIQRLFNLKG